MAKVAIEDLSGTSTPVTGNPYDPIINAAGNDLKQLQSRYDLHRSTRNKQQKEKILSDQFNGWILDPFLSKLDGPQRQPDFIDPRNCLVFWARPPTKVKALISLVQQKLKQAAPAIWLMPLNNLHMTAMEVTHSLTAAEIDHLVSILLPSSQDIADYTSTHRSRIIKPMVSYDSAALALSFVPATGEALSHERQAKEDEYSYHHLRRDLHSTISRAGLSVGSRYVVPSAHLTIARFNTPNVFDEENTMDPEAALDVKKRHRWIREIETINDWLKAEYWPQEDDTIKPGGEWIVGEEKGLDFRKGRLWYGGGETVKLGKGFQSL